ncbi:MAG: 3-ketoacyl-ACP reductase [Candidatus Hydrogenedentes bacterium]|nr:3-ketoacyl-ACP reductase [Candidatus Hydrogenedentota bacterium]
MGKAVALVTGASRGIGRGIATALASHGYDIAGVATSMSSGLLDVQADVEALGQRFIPVVADISRLDEHARIVDAVVEAAGRIDVLVNNAGVAPKVRLDILDTTEESFDRLIDINLRGPFFLTQRVSAQMIAQVKAGADCAPKIIFITSISSNAASPNRAEYCISKAGLSMAAQTYAVRLAEFGINVYDIRPGIVATDMTSAVKQKYDDLIAKGLLLTPRWGTPEDVGKAVVALAEGYFDYATGAVIEVGGGFGVERL